MHQLEKANAVQVLPRRKKSLIHVKQNPQRLIERNIDEKNFRRFVVDLAKIPYLEVEGRLGVKKDFKLFDDKVHIETNLGANVSLEYKDAKIELEHAFAGIRARGSINKDAKDSNISPDEHNIEKYRGGSFEYSLEMLNKEDTKVLQKKTELNINGKQYIDKLETIHQESLQGIDKKDISLVGDAHSYSFGHVANIRVRKGYDKKALENTKEFYIKNEDSIKRGFSKETKKHAGDIYKKTDKALKDYIDMPYVID